MYRSIKSFFGKTKQTLFTFNNEPFSRFSIVLIFILDIFLFITIMSGVNSEKNMLPEPSEKYPYQCQNHFDANHQTQVWDNTTSRYTQDAFPFSQYASFYVPYNQGYYSTKSVQVYDDGRTAKTCLELYKKIEVFTSSEAFQNNKALEENLKNEKRNTLSEINNIEQRYNTALFEKISEVNEETHKEIKKSYNTLLEKEKNIDIQLKGIKKVSQYEGYDAYVEYVNTHREAFKKELDSYIFWQPFISFLYLLKFTLPLLLLAFLAYRYSTNITRQASVPNKLITLISSHIMIITLLPIFIDTMYLIYHIIPHRFLASVIAFLYQIGFIFLGYYFLMFLGIIAVGLLIFFIQNAISKREKLRKEMKEKTLYIDAYNEHKCPNCKNRVTYEKPHCGYCGETLLRECASCGKHTPAHIAFCIECGASSH